MKEYNFVENILLYMKNVKLYIFTSIVVMNIDDDTFYTIN